MGQPLLSVLGTNWGSAPSNHLFRHSGHLSILKILRFSRKYAKGCIKFPRTKYKFSLQNIAKALRRCAKSMNSLVHKYPGSPHSTSNTHTRAEYLTIPALQFSKSCNNLSDPSYYIIISSQNFPEDDVDDNTYSFQGGVK